MTDTCCVTFRVEALAEPGLLPRLLQPFARRDITPDAVSAARHGEGMRVEIRVESLAAGTAPLIAGNLGQVVGVLRVETRDREAELRAAA